jgi:purine nucleosidase
MTNVAAALARRPSLASRIPRLTIMGGHLREIAHGGTVFGPGIDYNLCSDPEASLAVLGAGVPTRLVTGDVTLQTWLTRGGLERIAARGGALRAALAAAVREWTPIMYRLFGFRGDAAAPQANVAFLHDPLALVSVFDESFCTFEDLAVEPAIVDGVFRTFERPLGEERGHVMRCATAVDASRFHDFFVERIASL